MQKFTILIGSLCTLVVLGIGLSSCKDDEPFVKPNLSVSTETLSVSEAAGTIEVEIVLDRAAPSGITVEYDLGGTATSPADYSIVGTEGEVEIAQGQTSAVIQIQIVSDALYEGDETIEVSLQDVDSDDIVITNDDEAVITITDDDPQITASFETATMNVSEEDGILNIVVTLSQNATQDVTLQYTLGGTARDSVTARAADPVLPADYSIINETPGEIVIASGQAQGIIRLSLYNDFEVEDGNPETAAWDPETIVISLTSATSGVQISATNDEMTINVAQQDGKVIALFWDEGTTIDMDLFLWIGVIGSDLSEYEVITLSAFDGTEGPEVVFIPAVITDAGFGVSYTYYSGDVTPNDFEAHFIDFADGALGDREIYTGSYTLANLNEWTTLDDIVHIEQTFDITENGEYVNISSITTPTEGSRVATYQLPKGLKKTTGNSIYQRKKF